LSYGNKSNLKTTYLAPTSSGHSCSAFARVPLALWVRSRK